MTAERRKFARKTIAGTAEITAVHGDGEVPKARATLVNCSRGGALLRLPAPKRRLLQKARPLALQDSVTCVLRVAPTYQEIEVFAEVVRHSWAGSADNQLVGLRFFYDAQRRSHTDKSMRHLIQALGPEAWGESSEGGAVPVGGSARLPAASARTKKTSARVQKTSARVRTPSSRVERLDGEARKVTIKYHPGSSSSGRLPAAPRASSPMAGGGMPIYFGLAGPESGLYLRGTAQLVDGRAVIDLPDHFAGVAEPGSLTVHLTPCGQCTGLFVAKRSVRQVEVLELDEGKSDAPFDYLILGRRKGTA